MPFKNNNKGHFAKKYHEDFQTSNLSPTKAEPSITNQVKAHTDNYEDSKVCI